MHKIIHLSDLHFGTEQSNLINALLSDINKINPDVVIISGDLTQRARNIEYNAACSFLQSIPFPKLAVPGNHDIALYNIVERFFYPYRKYKRWINDQVYDTFVNTNLAVLGINSVTPFKIMGGYITKKQLNLVKDFFAQNCMVNKNKIIVMHHNLIRSERHKIINDSKKIIEFFANCNINLVLSGHIHLAKIETLKNNYNGRPMHIITAGTPVSNRTLESNSYNIIEIENDKFEFIIRMYRKDKFITVKERTYQL